MRTIRSVWPSMLRWMEDYPALITMIALLLVFVPYIKYPIWIYEGFNFGHAALIGGKNCFEKGDYKTATAHFDSALKYYQRPLIFDHSQVSEAEFCLAQAYHRRVVAALKDTLTSAMHRDLAMRIYRKFILPQPDRRYFLQSLAALFVNQKNLEPKLQTKVDSLAQPYLRASDKQLPQEAARFHHYLDEAYFLHGNFPEARKICSQARNRFPEDTTHRQATFEIAKSEMQFYIDQERAPEKVWSICQDTLITNPEDFTAHLAMACEIFKQSQLAAELYEKAISANPQNENIRAAAAHHYYDWGQQQAAENQFEAASRSFKRAYTLAPGKERLKYEAEANANKVILTISVEAMDTEGKAIANATVRIQDKVIGKTNNNGKFKIATPFLSAGKMQVEIGSPETDYYSSYREIVPGNSNYSIQAQLQRQSLSAYPYQQILRAITFGQSLRDTISTAGEVDIYIFKGTSRERIALDVLASESEGSALKPVLELWDQDGTRLDDDNKYLGGRQAHIEFVLPNTGLYFVVVKEYSGYGSGDGNFYTLQLRGLDRKKSDPKQKKEIYREAARSFYAWGNEQTSNIQFERAKWAYQRAYELMPNNRNYALAAKSALVALTISGHVRNLRGEAMAGVSIQVRDQVIAVTNDSGYYEGKKEFLSVGQLSIQARAKTSNSGIVDLEITPATTSYKLDFNVGPPILHINIIEEGAVSVVQRVFNEFGLGSTMLKTNDWTNIEFSPFGIVIISMNGGRPDSTSIKKIRTDVINQGKRVILIGGTRYENFVQGINQYLVLNNINDYEWKGPTQPHFTMVYPAHVLTQSIPKNYNFIYEYASHYQLRVTDSEIDVLAKNGDGYGCFFYKKSKFPILQNGTSKAGGDLIWFINPATDNFWKYNADYTIIKQIILNAISFQLENDVTENRPASQIR